MTRKLQDFPSVSIKPEELDGKIDFALLFGRTAPVHIEIGSGKATFLVGQATAYPEIDFLGLEWARKYYRYAVDRIGRRGLANVRIVRADAVTFLSDHIPDGSIECFHIYFPDPWPKRRHNKRRFFTPGNVMELFRCLQTAGRVCLATDYAEYFDRVRNLLISGDSLFEEIEFTPTAGAADGEYVGTNYERKYVKDKRRIYTLAVRKV